jgi:hypothetical protein
MLQLIDVRADGINAAPRGEDRELGAELSNQSLAVGHGQKLTVADVSSKFRVNPVGEQLQCVRFLIEQDQPLEIRYMAETISNALEKIFEDGLGFSAPITETGKGHRHNGAVQAMERENRQEAKQLAKSRPRSP